MTWTDTPQLFKTGFVLNTGCLTCSGSLCLSHRGVKHTYIHSESESQPYYPQPPSAVTMTTGWLGDTALSQKASAGAFFLPK